MRPACAARHPASPHYCFLEEGHAGAHEARISEWARAVWIGNWPVVS